MAGSVREWCLNAAGSERYIVPRTQMIAESLTWLDRYLGTVR